MQKGGLNMWEDFKEFAFQGNVVDLAVAVVIGAAFGQIVNSLVENIIMPTIGILLSGISFEGLSYTVGEAEITYGIFIQSVFDFFVISLSIFLFVRLLMKFRRTQEKEEKVNVTQEQLLEEIRDLLKDQTNKS